MYEYIGAAPKVETPIVAGAVIVLIVGAVALQTMEAQYSPGFKVTTYAPVLTPIVAEETNTSEANGEPVGAPVEALAA
jgi:hypothetical protein